MNGSRWKTSCPPRRCHYRAPGAATPAAPVSLRKTGILPVRRNSYRLEACATRKTGETPVLQLPLRTRHAFDSWVALAGQVQRFRQRLEDCFDNVMRFITAEQIDMQIAPRFVGETLQELFHQTDAKLFLPSERHIGNAIPILRFEDEEWSIAKIQSDARLSQRFVHGHQRPAITPNPALVAQRLYERLSQRNTDVLDRVMRIHIEVALRLDGQITQRMLGQQRQHVIEEWDPGRHVRLAAAINRECQRNLCLRRIALNLSASFSHSVH